MSTTQNLKSLQSMLSVARRNLKKAQQKQDELPKDCDALAWQNAICEVGKRAEKVKELEAKVKESTPAKQPKSVKMVTVTFYVSDALTAEAIEQKIRKAFASCPDDKNVSVKFPFQKKSAGPSHEDVEKAVGQFQKEITEGAAQIAEILK